MNFWRFFAETVGLIPPSDETMGFGRVSPEFSLCDNCGNYRVREGKCDRCGATKVKKE
jgi:hypothetical protein